MEILASGNPL